MPITPDTKDWTWVLRRICPECGFDVRSFPREDTGRLIRATAARWDDVLAHVDVERRRSNDVWSPLEYGCHVRDVFSLYDERLRMMLEEEDPLFPNWDQDASAVDDDYISQDPRAVARELQVAAAQLADSFDALKEAQWERTGRRSDGAAFTIESFARYLVHDPIHHLHDVAYLTPASR